VLEAFRNDDEIQWKIIDNFPPTVHQGQHKPQVTHNWPINWSNLFFIIKAK